MARALGTPRWYHPGVRALIVPVFVGTTLLVAVAPALAAGRTDPLVRARRLYNEGDYQGAVAAAAEARARNPARSNSADLVAARAYIERFRVSADASDVANARDILGV